MHRLNALFLGSHNTEYFRRHSSRSEQPEDGLRRQGRLSAYATFFEENLQIGQQHLRMALWYCPAHAGTPPAKRTTRTCARSASRAWTASSSLSGPARSRTCSC